MKREDKWAVAYAIFAACVIAALCAIAESI